MKQVPQNVRRWLLALAVVLMAVVAVLILVSLTRDGRSRCDIISGLAANAPEDAGIATDPGGSAPDQPAPPAPVKPPPAAPNVETPPEELKPEKEDLDRLDVRMRNDYPPHQAPNVSVEYLSGGGIRVTVQSPGVNSMSAAYGLPIARKVVRELGLSDQQLARVQRFEKEFLAAVDARTADVYAPVETIALDLSEAITGKRWSDFRRGVDQLTKQMKAVNDRWRTLYQEYLSGLEPLLTPEQAAKARASLLPNRPER